MIEPSHRIHDDASYRSYQRPAADDDRILSFAASICTDHEVVYNSVERDVQYRVREYYLSRTVRTVYMLPSSRWPRCRKPEGTRLRPCLGQIDDGSGRPSASWQWSIASTGTIANCSESLNRPQLQLDLQGRPLAMAAYVLAVPVAGQVGCNVVAIYCCMPHS